LAPSPLQPKIKVDTKNAYAKIHIYEAKHKDTDEKKRQEETRLSRPHENAQRPQRVKTPQGKRAQKACGMRAIALWLIGLYQKVFFFLPKRCKYIPSCSEYAKEAFSRYGLIRAGMMAAGRLLRCNPWAKGGFDPVK
jgi:hypothetical protein